MLGKLPEYRRVSHRAEHVPGNGLGSPPRDDEFALFRGIVDIHEPADKARQGLTGPYGTVADVNSGITPCNVLDLLVRQVQACVIRHVSLCSAISAGCR